MVTAADRRVYVGALASFGELTRADVEEGLAIVQPLSYAPRTWLLRAGERATRASVVVHGLVRELFVLADGTERTKAFVHEGGITGSLADLLAGGPSRGCIVAEEPTRVLSFEYADFLALASRRPRWEAIRVKVLERLLAAKAEREHELLGLDAAARYERFGERHPGLETRIAARHLASYLGITPEHLSRLRRRRRLATR
jgi:CRP-like cAMP-binding protein